VRAKPGDQASRLFLFELLAFSGELDRATKQVDALTIEDPDLHLAALNYRQCVESEQARRKIFSGEKPEFFAEPDASTALRLEALGDLGDGLTTEVWWSPSHPFTSSLTKQSAKSLAESYETSTKKQWTQPIGFAHALFEVASDALKRSKSLNASDVRDAVAASKLKTVVGDVAWGGQGPFKNVSKTPLVLGQWNKGKKYKYELSIVNNETAKNIPTDSKLRLN
jgi:hypothetical protein